MFYATVVQGNYNPKENVFRVLGLNLTKRQLIWFEVPKKKHTHQKKKKQKTIHEILLIPNGAVFLFRTQGLKFYEHFLKKKKQLQKSYQIIWVLDPRSHITLLFTFKSVHHSFIR